MANQLADIGLIGLAVMGENLILNMANHGFTVCCYNRTVSKVDEFLNGRAKGKSIIGLYLLVPQAFPGDYKLLLFFFANS
jgi:6-phosphogluconate dehydrogenase